MSKRVRCAVAVHGNRTIDGSGGYDEPRAGQTLPGHAKPDRAASSDPTVTTDFDTAFSRRDTDSVKWRKYPEEVLPVWVADMDFQSPLPVRRALAARVEHGVYGYGEVTDELRHIVTQRLLNRYGWQVDAGDLVFFPGVVPALNVICRGFTAADGRILTAVPIYHPFLDMGANAGREMIHLQAVVSDGRWEFPVDALARAGRAGDLLLLCNPYNPVGRHLTGPELAAIVQVCDERGIQIASDEIHCDLPLDGQQHQPLATVAGVSSRQSITLMAASKTFNLAGIGGGFAVVPDAGTRRHLDAVTAGVLGNINIMAALAMQVAFESCNEWHRDLLTYLAGNRDYLVDRMQDLPITMSRVEATYLAWLDVRALELADPATYFEEAGVGMSDGAQFGGGGYMRLNFGCPRSRLGEVVDRLQAAVEKR